MSNIVWKPFIEVTIFGMFMFAVPYVYTQKRETIAVYQ